MNRILTPPPPQSLHGCVRPPDRPLRRELLSPRQAADEIGQANRLEIAVSVRPDDRGPRTVLHADENRHGFSFPPNRLPFSGMLDGLVSAEAPLEQNQPRLFITGRLPLRCEEATSSHDSGSGQLPITR